MNKITPTIVLMYYDYPQVFVGKNAVDQNYCCMAISESDFGPEYLCTPISNYRLNSLLAGSIDLRRVFEDPELRSFFHACYDPQIEDAISIHQEEMDFCPEDLLPGAGLYFEGYDEVASKALELNTTVTYASLSVPESEKQSRIRSGTLAQFLIYYRNALKFLAKKTAKDCRKKMAKDVGPFDFDVFGVSHGSFTVQLRSSSDGDLLGDNHIMATALDQLGTFLDNLENTKAALDYLQSIKGHSASSLVKLLEFLNENNCPLKQQWSTPRIGESRISKTTIAGVRNLVEACRWRNDLTEEKVVITGIVSSASINGNTWKLIGEDDGIQYSGDVNEGSKISMSGIVIKDKRYKFHCIERIDQNIATGQERVRLSLFNIEEIE